MKYVNEHELGLPTCAGVMNSSGQSGRLRVTGSRAVVDDNIVLSADRLPPHSFGYFLVSRVGAPPANPPGSAGNLCLGSGIGRFVGPGQVLGSGSSGSFALRIDLTAVPEPTGFVPVLAGEARHFQCWHRDQVGPVTTSNFTGAVALDFL